MNTYLLYLLQASLCLIIFYVIYWIFMRRDTFFMINRIYLIGSIILSLLIPVINFSNILPQISNSYYVLLDTVVITPAEVSSTIEKNLDIFQIIFIIYLTGVAIFLTRFLAQIIQLLIIMSRFGIKEWEGYRFVPVENKYSPFSFFNIIFIDISQKEGKDIHEIITHESIHIRQLHTMDVLILEFLTILFWFNPFVWFYRRSVKSIHEFLADEGVLSLGTNKVYYQKLLLQQSLGVMVNDLTNNFNHSLIKRRFIMMTKSKSSGAARLKPLVALPLVVLLMILTSVGTNIFAQDDKSIPPPPPKKGDQEAKEIQKAQQSDVQEEKEIHKVVEVMPEYPGGTNAMIDYLVENIKYPDIAKKQGVTAKVFVKFIVEKDGVIRGASIIGTKTSLDKEKYTEALNALKKEAMRVIYGMPKWKPGMQDGKAVNVEYALPISFNLDSDKEKQEK